MCCFDLSDHLNELDSNIRQHLEHDLKALVRIRQSIEIAKNSRFISKDVKILLDLIEIWEAIEHGTYQTTLCKLKILKCWSNVKNVKRQPRSAQVNLKNQDGKQL